MEDGNSRPFYTGTTAKLEYELDYTGGTGNYSLNTTNILAIISALVAGLNGVDGITIPYAIQIIQIIEVVQGVIGTYLLGNKAVETLEKGE